MLFLQPTNRATQPDTNQRPIVEKILPTTSVAGIGVQEKLDADTTLQQVEQVFISPPYGERK